MSYPAVPPQPGSHTARFGGFRAGAGEARRGGVRWRPAVVSCPPRLPDGRTAASNTLSE